MAGLDIREIEIVKRHPPIGAEVRGVDLGRPIDDDTFEALHQAWMEHLLLIFPGQAVSDEAHIAFGQKFGELEVHPSLAHRSSLNKEIYRVSNVDEAGNLIPPKETS